MELHGFADTSEKAYAAAIYLRTQTEDGFSCRLIVSKTRVAPVKLTTIPRLELQSAVLLVKLMAHLKRLWNFDEKHIHYWSDATIVLSWIHSSPTKWKTYVANRVTQLQEKSSPSQWAHVISEENPADIASRGCNPDELHHDSLWFTGPSWLSQPDYEIPKFNPKTTVNEFEEAESKSAINVAVCPGNPILTSLAKLHSWKKAIKVFALIRTMFLRKSFIKTKPLLTHILPSQLKEAEIHLCSLLQQQAFPHLEEAIANDYKAHQFKKYSHFKLLRVYKDDTIFRVGGRLANADLEFSAKHPIIIPGSHVLVRLMILEAHERLGHAGRNTVHYHIRQRFWIHNATKSIKSVIDKCLVCFKYQAQGTTQAMAQLPSARVSTIRPFLKIGVDFAGPFLLKPFVGRKTNFKAWISIFTCMATRAIHLELVSSLSHEGFLLAFRRFIARRGRPTDVFSDNGTNFVGANRHLKEVQENRDQLESSKDKFLPDLAVENINWHFNPPSAPHMGGSWESMIKLVKSYLKKIFINGTFNYEDTYTILLFVESMVNSRPITAISNDAEDPEALTPGHFLIGSSLQAIPEHSYSHLKLNRMNHYQRNCAKQQELWIRFEKEYITNLQKSNKWSTIQENLAVGDLVLILDEESQPLHWKTGRIKEIHPGKDKLVRIATIETGSSYEDVKTKKTVKTFKDIKGPLSKTWKEVLRPISKLAKLPMEDQNDNDDPPGVINSIQGRIPQTSPWNWLMMITLLTFTFISKTTAETVTTIQIGHPRLKWLISTPH